MSSLLLQSGDGLLLQNAAALLLQKDEQSLLLQNGDGFLLQDGTALELQGDGFVQIEVYVNFQTGADYLKTNPLATESEYLVYLEQTHGISSSLANVLQSSTMQEMQSLGIEVNDFADFSAIAAAILDVPLGQEP